MRRISFQSFLIASLFLSLLALIAQGCGDVERARCWSKACEFWAHPDNQTANRDTLKDPKNSSNFVPQREPTPPTSSTNAVGTLGTQRLDPRRLDPWRREGLFFSNPSQSFQLETQQRYGVPSSQFTPPGSGKFIAHEWGTFTSVQSSEGKVLDGLHHEEEKLPTFVHRRSKIPGNWKGIEGLPANVTQKLETPVIYFYTPKAMDVQVDVQFPQGVISEYYPDATKFTPEIAPWNGFGRTDLERIPKDGSMQWKVRLEPGLRHAPPAVDAHDIWAPSRQVPDATPLFYKSPFNGPSIEVEKFIFYRGVGRFQGWFEAKTTADGQIHLKNQSTETVPRLFLLRVEGEQGAVVELDAMKSGETRTVTPPSTFQALDEYVTTATQKVAAALIRSGLTKDEAWAMVNTWRYSYFKSQTTGIRILYIVPRKDTDALLPINIAPQPDELVRVLVGRIELLTPQVEAETLRLVTLAYQNRQSPDLTAYGRFAEAKLRRAYEMLTDPNIRTFCKSLIDLAANVP